MTEVKLPTAAAVPQQPIPLASIVQAIAFTRHVYDSQQAVIRQLDVKAGVMVGVLSLLLTTTLSLSREVPTKLHLTGHGSVVSDSFILSLSILAVGFIWTVWEVQGTILPRAGGLNATSGHMFSLEILNHGSHAGYHEAFRALTDEHLLEALTSNVYSLSSIAKDKIDALRRANRPISVTLVAWVFATGLSLYIGTWK